MRKFFQIEPPEIISLYVKKILKNEKYMVDHLRKLIVKKYSLCIIYKF